MSTFSLPKANRLHSRKSIEELFEKGESFFMHPIKVVAQMTTFNDDMAVKAAFSVSKRNFKHAVDRNRYKRLLRETYRLNQSPLHENMAKEQHQLAVMFIYAVKEHNDYATVEKAMKKALAKLQSKYSQTYTNA
ncbi:MAG: ribonuclease P protein component [Mangrovibacterium sp.]